MIDPHAYNITIRRSTFEGEVLFEARVKELPDLAEYGESYEEAYSLAIDTIEIAAEAFEEKGRSFPPAIVPADEFSGRVTLRLPRSLHRSLATVAEDEGVSLNQHLVNVLSYYSGFSAIYRTGVSASWQPMPKQQTSKPERKPSLRIVRSDDLQAAS